jgi:hypothetical protein
MSVLAPLIDFPRGRLARGGAEFWDTIQAGVIISGEVLTLPDVVLVVDNCSLDVISNSLAVSQNNILLFDDVELNSATQQAGVSQDHFLLFENCLQNNEIESIYLIGKIINPSTMFSNNTYSLLFSKENRSVDIRQ